jgi:hypothetical protein
MTKPIPSAPPPESTADHERRSVALTVLILPDVLLGGIDTPLSTANPYMRRLLWGLMTIADRDRRALLAAAEFRYPELAAIDWTCAATISALYRRISASER